MGEPRFVGDGAWLSLAAKSETLSARAVAYHQAGTPAEMREAHTDLMRAVHDYARAYLKELR